MAVSANFNIPSLKSISNSNAYPLNELVRKLQNDKSGFRQLHCLAASPITDHFGGPMVSPTQTVQQVYIEFGKGNIEGVLNLLADDVTWIDPGFP
jgi:hypothetical protein